jgi:hypothetical protein
VVPRVYHSIHTPQQTRQVGRPCSPRLLPRHPYLRDARNPIAVQQSAPTHHVLLPTC